MSRIATSFTSKLSSTATSPVLRIEKPDSGPWTFVYCLSQGLIKPYTSEKRMQKNLLNLPKSSCKRSPQYLPHTHGSASKRHWTPQPFLLAKQDESRSTQTELDGLKVFQQIPQFPHITGIYRSCCSLQSVFDAICSAKKSWGTRAWHLSNYVHVKLHLLDVFSLASKGVWQQAGLQHIGFAAHVCRSFELVFSWMFFVCLSAAVSCVYGLGGKRIVIYSTKDMFNVDQDQNFQKQSIFKVSMCQDFPFWRQKSIYSVYAGAIKKGLRHVGKLGKVVPQDREVTLMEWRCSGWAKTLVSPQPSDVFDRFCTYRQHVQDTLPPADTEIFHNMDWLLASARISRKRSDKVVTAARSSRQARPNIGIKAIETVGNLGKPLRPYGWSNILRQALEHKAICLRFQHEGLCSIFFSHLQT